MSRETPPQVDKSEWSEADFDAMGWHDVFVRAWTVERDHSHPGRMVLDLDYILGWITPAGDETSFSYWISPATLVFDHAWELSLDMSLGAIEWGPQIDEVTRQGGQPHERTLWTVAGHDFRLSVSSEGFRQYLRRALLWSPSQRLDNAQRGGISFEEVGYLQ